MCITMDLHTHTLYSRHHHGKGTVEENVRAAREKGIGVAISDHGPGHGIYGVKPRWYRKLRQDIDRENDRAGARVALLGVEANVMDWDGRLDVEKMPFSPDVMLFGYHRGVLPFSGAAAGFWEKALLHPARCEEAMTKAVCRAMERYPVDVLTHPGDAVPVDIRTVARAAARLGVVLEINNTHGLDPALIRIAMEEGAYFILQSDAHRPERVGCVEHSRLQAAEAGLPESRIVNSPAYDWSGKLRIDRLRTFVENLPQLSTAAPR